MNAQLDLFEHVLKSYAHEGGPLSNDVLYAKVASSAGVPLEIIEKKVPIGKSGEMHSPFRRRVRWYQQTLRALGLLEKDDVAGRGHWKLTPKAKQKLTPAQGTAVMLGFSTDLGVALWAASSSVFPLIGEPITLCLTSPPYPLKKARAYGNPPIQEYVDFILKQMEPIVRHLAPGGSICLNVSNDIFEDHSPARSTYKERMLIALEDKLGLKLMDTLIWHNPNKPPGPIQWASLSRQQLNVAYEPVYWMTNDPRLCKSDNRRVLQQHTEQHMKLLNAGGERRSAVYGDGAYRLREGSFGKRTDGRIPRNILQFSHVESEKNEFRKEIQAQGLPHHGAMMPRRLARLLIEFLTEPGDLVVDNHFGHATTLIEAEDLGRRWFGAELMAEHVLGGALRFKDRPGFHCFGSLA